MTATSKAIDWEFVFQALWAPRAPWGSLSPLELSSIAIMPTKITRVGTNKPAKLDHR